MEFFIVAGLAAAGYYYNNTDNDRASTEQKVIKRTDMAGLRPYDSDPYNSSVIEQQRAKEQQLADDRAQKARDPWRTGVYQKTGILIQVPAHLLWNSAKLQLLAVCLLMHQSCQRLFGALQSRQNDLYDFHKPEH